MSDPIVGIDLGTTNSLVAICDEAGPRIISVDQNAAALPSVVRYGVDSVEAVGQHARDRAVEYPVETIYSIKRLMGRSLEDRLADANALAYSVVEGPRGIAAVSVNGRVRTPQEVSADILTVLAEAASRELGVPVRRAVITVPAYFDDAQRQATRDAGRLAGLEVVRVVNEPTAAALAYGIGSRSQTDPEKLLIYDLGGGTFDVTVLEVVPPEDAASDSADEDSIYQVLSSTGDTALGGDDVDRGIMDLVLHEMTPSGAATLRPSPGVRQALRDVSEKIKIELSESEIASLRIDAGNDIGVIDRTLTRSELEKIIDPLVDRSLRLCEKALREAHLTPEDIDRVVMVGGSTRIPMVRKRVGELFGQTPYTALNPDQVVALGAAVQASIISGERTDMLLLDVVPLGLGIETVGGAVAKLVTSNSTIPVRAVEMFSTSVDGQVNVALHVVQGEREMVADCRSLAKFELRGLPPMPAGIPQVEVEFIVDANGVLDVQAVERRSGCRAEVQVVPSYGLTRDEIEEMERDSLTHAREDMTIHRVVDLAVNASLDVKWIDEALDRVRDVISSDVIDQVEHAREQVLNFIASAQSNPRDVDADAFNAAKDHLDRASIPVHEAAITKSLKANDGEH